MTGYFNAKRRTNKKGISIVRATFAFHDDIVSGLGFKKIKFKDKNTNSFFGDADNPQNSEFRKQKI